ncbi:MAG: HD domain-containing protein [Clostridiales bacterium]|nr:HD domain-containing protein [Clostridiales bacterium]
MADKKNIIKNVFIVVLGIFLNLTGRLFADSFELPVWLDTVGTCIVAYFTNVYFALGVAMILHVILAISNIKVILYMLISAMAAIFVRVAVKKDAFKSIRDALILGTFIGIAATVLSIPIDMYVYGGQTCNIWGDALYDMLAYRGYPKVLCLLADEFVVNLVDKQLSVALAFMLAGIIDKAERRINPGVVLTVCMLPFIMCNTVYADDEIDFGEYVYKIYNNENGLPSSEANAIEETEDGYIWIGGYAGLTRYDGTNFKYITEGGISNVTAMTKDLRGRLIIGTNDAGVAIYDNGKFTIIGKKDGLVSNAIRSLYCDDMYIYVGTVSGLSLIDEKGNVKNVSSGCIMSISKDSSNHLLYVDNNGALVSCKNYLSTQVNFDENYVFRVVYCVNRKVYLATNDGQILICTFEGEKLTVSETYRTEKAGNVTGFFCDRSGIVLFCGENGIGYIKNNTVYENVYDGFAGNIENITQDFQGNYWFCSSRSGVMKLCKNSFTDVFKNAGAGEAVVNAVAEHNGLLYCGTDNGIMVFDKATEKIAKSDLQALTNGCRVRCIYNDSQNRLWICCYGGPGLICLDNDENITYYNRENKHIEGDRFRTILELYDGTIVAGTTSALYFIQNGEITGVIDKYMGYPIVQVLSLAQGNDGTIYAGSDGAGIYVINDRKITNVITEEEGLASLIVLRLVNSDNGFWVVTSNSLQYMEDDKLHRLDKFPYFNNYDVKQFGDEVWVLSSRGIYICNRDNLIKNENVNYRLYDISNGLLSSITVNSWAYVDTRGTLYFCTNKGVKKISMLNTQEQSDRYKMRISSAKADDIELEINNRLITLPSDVERLEILPSICNYRLQDLKVGYYLSGVDSDIVKLNQSEINSIIYNKLENGTYSFYLFIYDESGEKVIQSEVYTIVKESRFWETTAFKIYLITVIIWFIAYVLWQIFILIQTYKRKAELEECRKELETKVDEQTYEIREQAGRIVRMQWDTIEGMAALIESRDGNTGEHVRKTRKYVQLIAEEMYYRQLYPQEVDEKFVSTIVEAAPLHDVGKIKISDVILNKPGKFTEKEFSIMKSHAAIGGEIVGDILGKDADEYLVNMARDIASYHHEKWNGQGYPKGLKGKEIPLCARIMAVADVFDALISKRVYKEAMSIEEGFAEIERCSGSHFDPEIAEIFLEIKDKIINEVELLQ